VVQTRILILTVIALWAASFLLFISLLVTNIFFLRRLSTRHVETWTQLGRPSLIRNNSIANNFSTLRFLRKKEYVALQDVVLTRLAKIVWAQGLLYLLVFGSSLLATAVFFLR
jgi:hypothetical protein